MTRKMNYQICFISFSLIRVLLITAYFNGYLLFNVLIPIGKPYLPTAALPPYLPCLIAHIIKASIKYFI